MQHLLKYLADSSKKSCWKFIKFQKQDSTGIIMLQISTSEASTAPEITKTLNNQVFTTEDTYSIPDMPESPYPPITDINITAPGVYKLLSKLRSSLWGPWPWHYLRTFLKCTATKIMPILLHKFQQSPSTGDVPSQWKMAYVIATCS